MTDQYLGIYSRNHKKFFAKKIKSKEEKSYLRRSYRKKLNTSE